jgi:hypothetical protein
MPFLRNITSGLRSLFRKNQVDRELDEELGAYLEMEGGWPGTPTPNFRLRSIERGNSRTLANQTDTEGAQVRRLNLGSWVCLPLPEPRGELRRATHRDFCSALNLLTFKPFNLQTFFPSLATPYSSWQLHGALLHSKSPPKH